MVSSEYKIMLDFHAMISPAILNVKRGDTGRKLHIVLVDGGRPYRISEDCYAVFTAKKPDGKIVHNPCEVAGNTIIYELTPQTVAAEGLVECEVKLYGNNDKLITSAAFGLLVNKTVYNEGDKIESSDEFSALNNLMVEAKKYIDSLLQSASVRIVQVKLLASAWVGSGNLYSQVVSIDGITENSQVNLTPSVQQLSIFYEKDITFSTENDGGVVTVYVIGQKPENDYTIQANIVEVNV